MNLELISLRYLEQGIESIIKDRLKQIIEQKDIQKDWDIRVFRRNKIYTEILIALISNNRKAALTKSSFGTLLADSLKPFGTVIHDTWSELLF